MQIIPVIQTSIMLPFHHVLYRVHGDYIRGINPNNDNQKLLLKKIHTDSVAATIAALCSMHQHQQ